MIKSLVPASVMLLLAFSIPAAAQTTSPPFDPRTVPQAINALQAMLALREAQLKALHEDADKRESDWSAYSTPLWWGLEPAKP